jgi:hypothetical protein
MKMMTVAEFKNYFLEALDASSGAACDAGICFAALKTRKLSQFTSFWNEPQ